MYYQPQHDFSGRFIGAEALLRWNHPSFGMIAPPVVIHIAQESGMLAQLERYILRRVFLDAPEIEREAGASVSICVNVTGTTLMRPDFTDFLQELKEKEQISNGLICLEVTENMVLSLNENLKGLFEKIRQMGFLLAIDDFSMGNTSLNWLKSNQFDLVKLDGALVRDVKNNRASREIIDSIVYLSNSLGFTVLAEYVETEEQKMLLNSLGCTHYQGYLYSKAIPIVELKTYLAEYRKGIGQEAVL